MLVYPPRTRQLVQHAAFRNIKSEEKAVLFFTQLKEKRFACSISRHSLNKQRLKKKILLLFHDVCSLSTERSGLHGFAIQM